MTIKAFPALCGNCSRGKPCVPKAGPVLDVGCKVSVQVVDGFWPRVAEDVVLLPKHGLCHVLLTNAEIIAELGVVASHLAKQVLLQVL